MENSNHYEQEVDLKTLIFAILYRWRLILLIAILGGVLLGGIRLAKGLIKIQDTEGITLARKDFEDEYSLYKSTKESYEREIENLTLKVESFNEYMTDSVLMQISPYDKPVAVADIYIKSDYEIMPGMLYQNRDYTDSLVKAYSLAVSQGDLLKNMSEIIKFSDLQYLSELITARPDYDNKMLHIEVTYSNIDTADRILSQILKNIDNYTANLSDTIGVHQISVTNRSKFHTVDMELVDRQDNNRNTESSLQNALLNKKDALENLEEPTFTAYSKKTTLKSGIKYGIMGGILGTFIVIFFLCVGFLLSDKLMSEKELRNRFCLRVLGVLGIVHDKKFFSRIDRWLDKIHGAEDITDLNGAYQLISVNVQNASDSAELIMVVGTAGDTLLLQASEHLTQFLPDRKILLAGNMNRAAEALQTLTSCDKVILIEQRGVSTFTGIERELETLKTLKKTILGCILY